MSIYVEIRDFLRSYETMPLEPVVKMTRALAMRYNTVHPKLRNRFFHTLPLFFSGLHNRKALLEVDWDDFDKTFRDLLVERARTIEPEDSSLLSLVADIESCAARRFSHLRPEFLPVLVEGPDSTYRLLSRAAFSQDPALKAMLGPYFEEGEKAKVKFANFTRGSAFHSVCDWLQGRTFTSSQYPPLANNLCSKKDMAEIQERMPHLLCEFISKERKWKPEYLLTLNEMALFADMYDVRPLQDSILFFMKRGLLENKGKSLFDPAYDKKDFSVALRELEKTFLFIFSRNGLPDGEEGLWHRMCEDVYGALSWDNFELWLSVVRRPSQTEKSMTQPKPLFEAEVIGTLSSCTPYPPQAADKLRPFLASGDYPVLRSLALTLARRRIDVSTKLSGDGDIELGGHYCGAELANIPLFLAALSRLQFGEYFSSIRIHITPLDGVKFSEREVGDHFSRLVRFITNFDGENPVPKLVFLWKNPPENYKKLFADAWQSCLNEEPEARREKLRKLVLEIEPEAAEAAH